MTVDERVMAGMRDQLARRDALLAAGARQIGWKVGFGSPEAMTRLGLAAPLVGHLLDRGLLPDGAAVPVAGWVQPMLEVEVAVHLGRDVAGDADDEEVLAAVAGLSVAVELADLDPPPEDVRSILAGNIFHRHVTLGPVDATRRSSEGVRAVVAVDGAEVGATDHPETLTGALLHVVRSTAATVAACGERLRAGEVVITGSVLPPRRVEPGQRVTVALEPLGRLTLSFT